MADNTPISCPACGRPNKVGRKFCGGCGALLPVTCPACGALNDPDDRFCGSCGSALSQGAAPEPTPSAPPPPVPTVPSSFAKERRLVTVLFADLVGSTSLGEQMDPEDVDDLIAEVHTVVEECVDQFGGHIVRHMGDGIMAIFGAPIAQEDDAERAVLAALTMQQQLEEKGARRPAGIALPSMRVGITSGEVIAGEIGGVYDVIGDAANTAARLQGEAPVGGVLVGQEAMHLAQRRIRFGERQDLTLKGKAEPVPAYPALGLGARFEERWELGGAVIPLLGRDAEMNVLLDAWKRAQGGEGGLISVVGDPGVGKSRLIAEFLQRTGADGGVRIARGRCLSYSQGMSLWLLADLLRDVCRLHDGSPAEEVRGRLAATIPDLLADADAATRDEATDVLGEVLGLEEGRSTVEEAGAQIRRQALLRSLRLVLASLARGSPTLAVMEDLHWIDPASADTLSSVLVDLPGLRMLVIASQRPGWTAPWSDWGWPERLTLRPLDSVDASQLASSVLGGLPLSPDLDRYVAERAGGNPFFVEEMLRDLQERGHIVERDGHAHLASGAVEALPSTLTEVLLARLDRLDAESRSVTQVASVIGRSFTVRLLAAVMGKDSSKLMAPLTTLQRAEIAFPRAHSDLEYVFKHASIREVAYNTLVHKRRQQLHLATARAVSLLYPADESVEMIAYHFAHTDEHREAAHWLERAGDRAADVYANDSAITYYQEAGRRLQRCDATPIERARLEEKAGMILRTAARYDEAIGALESAAEVYRSAGDHEGEGRVLAQIGEAHYERGSSSEGIARLRPFLEDEDPDPVRVVPSSCIASAHAAMALLSFAAARPGDALAAAERASACARAAGDTAVTARAEVSRGLALLALSRREDARSVLEEALPLAEASNDLETLARALDNLSNVHYFRGELDASRAYLLRGFTVAERMGDPALTVHMLFMLGTNRFWAGEWDLSRSYCERARAVAELLGESRVSVLPLYGLGQLLMTQGDTDTATSYLEEVADVTQRHGIFHMTKWAQRKLADRELLEGRPEAVLRRLLPVLQIPGLGVSATILSAIAQAYIALGRDDEAADAIDHALDGAKVDDDHIDLSDALRAAAALAIRQHRWDDARALLDEGLTANRRKGFPLNEGLFLHELGSMHASAGEIENARRHFEEALALFDRLGARPYSEQASHALEALSTAT